MQAALENQLHPLDMFEPHFTSHEIVDLPQRCFSVFDSSGRLLSYERSESVALRPDASGLCRDEE